MIKNILLIASIVLLSVCIILFSYVLKDGDLCCKYSVCRNITNICEKEEEQEDKKGAFSENDIELILYEIEEGDKLEKDTVVTGEIAGSWYFEGEFPVRVFDSDGEEIDTLVATANEDWMTQENVSFEFVLSTLVTKETEITLKFEKSNPSGLKEYEDSIDMKFSLLPSQKSIVLKVYFPNVDMGSPEDCSKVFPVGRSVPETLAVGRASLEELFKGVTQDEKDLGYYSNINDGVVIQSLEISNGIARVDLNSRLEEMVGGSCKVTSIRAQISETLKQFPTVDTVVISIDGRTEDILQP